MNTRSLGFIVLAFFACAPRFLAGGQGTVILAGGGPLSPSIYQEFVNAVDGPVRRLVLIPTASDAAAADLERRSREESFTRPWRERGFDQVEVLHARSRQAADHPEYAALLDDATAVWISGGQQSRLSDRYVGTNVEAGLKAVLQRGGVVGGTSAGAAILSRVMIAGGKGTPVLRIGFDVVPHAIIDQHFGARQRLPRLQNAIRQHPDRIGIGIDERTAVVVRGKRATVLGAEEVVVVAQRNGQSQTTRYGGGDVFSVESPKAPRVAWALAIHGGAGTVPPDRLASHGEAYRAGLADALSKGEDILAGGGSSLDAVEAAIRLLEDNPLFNAGVGAVFNRTGRHELDASIMDGKTLDGGGVAGVRTIRHPIALARLVMDRTQHVLLAGAGAEAFADQQALQRVKNSDFSTEYRRTIWEQERRELLRGAAARPVRYWGTVGCVALDRDGNLAAGTSTGGLSNKAFGRVGDSPLIGSGTYADNQTCAVSGTGIGEQFIRHAAASQVSLLMRYRDWSLQRATKHVLRERLRPGDGGMIAVDSSGSIVWDYTTSGMFRGAANADGHFEVKIGDE